MMKKKCAKAVVFQKLERIHHQSDKKLRDIPKELLQ